MRSRIRCVIAAVMFVLTRPVHLRGAVNRAALVLVPAFLVAATSPDGAEHFTQRFDAEPINSRVLNYIGRNARDAITRTDGGLVVKLPVDKPDSELQAGVATKFKVDGDFEITLGYHLDKVEQPEKGYGAGVILRLSKSAGPRRRVNLSHFMHRTEGNVFVTNVWTDVKGKERRDYQNFSTEADHGQLRIVRKGPTVTYLVAEGDSDEFRELRQVEFGPEPLTAVDLLGGTGNSNKPITVRLTNLSIRADGLPFGLPPQRQRFFWHTWGALALLGVVVLIGSAVWFWRRRRDPNIHRLKVR